MLRDKDYPLERIPSEESYAIYSRRTGLVSSHATSADAIKNFAVHVKKNPNTDAAMFKRGRRGWKVF
jgi:hypothetical protein